MSDTSTYFFFLLNGIIWHLKANFCMRSFPNTTTDLPILIFRTFKKVFSIYARYVFIVYSYSKSNVLYHKSTTYECIKKSWIFEVFERFAFLNW